VPAVASEHVEWKPLFISCKPAGVAVCYVIESAIQFPLSPVALFGAMLLLIRDVVSTILKEVPPCDFSVLVLRTLGQKGSDDCA
jgi:hypothetical protein